MEIEKERQKIQLLLDEGKNSKERNILGQFSTPFKLACEITNMISKTLELPENINFLEPAIGTGVFYSALLSENFNLTKATGYEIDPYYGSPAKSLWNDYPLDIRIEDFFNANPSNEYNLIIANPPYSRHHHIDTETKKKLSANVLKHFGIEISGLAGLYCYFMILSSLWLKEEGISVWLVPSEFMDVNYGEALRQFLTTKVELISIHKFEADDLQFSDALVSSCVVIFKNKKPVSKDITLSSGKSLNQPSLKKHVSADNLKHSNKWSHFFTDDNTEAEQSGLPLGTYFNVSRGISTGNNSFFILDRESIDEAGIPDLFLTPILPAPRYLKTDVILESELNNYCKYLFSSNLPLDYIKDKFPSAYNYIHTAENNGIDKSYNCSRRKPWYSTEHRENAPFYLTYMARGENHDRMFRFILNLTNVTVSNSYLILTPKPEYKEDLKRESVRRKVWEILRSIPKKNIIRCGRCYGGGLYKIEPKELLNVTIPSLNTIFTHAPKSLFD